MIFIYSRLTIKWLCLPLTIFMLLVSCSAQPVPKDTFYRLTSSQKLPPLQGGPFVGVVEVQPLRGEGIINQRAIIYRDGPSQLYQYIYHLWAEPPGIMIQRELIAALRQAQAFESVASPEMRTNRDYELAGSLFTLEHALESSGGKVVIELELGLRRVQGNHNLLLKTYRSERSVNGPGVSSAVTSIRGALDEVLAQLLLDLEVAKSKEKA